MVRGKRLCIGAVAALTTFAAPAGASAAEQHVYAGGMNYLNPVVPVGKGDKLVFDNLDQVAKHDVASDDGKFKSKVIPGGESAPVNGVEKLSEGSYPFHCSLHSWMRGVVQVSASGGASPGAPSAGDLTLDGSNTPLGKVNATPDPMDLWPQADPAPLGKGAWRFYGKDLANTRDGGKRGPSVEEAPLLGPAWSFYSRDGDFTGTPVVARDLVVAGSNTGRVYALNGTTGKVRWQRKLGEDPVNNSVAISGGRVFVPVAKPHKPWMAALDLQSGKVLWKKRLDRQKDSDTYGAPVVWNGAVYMGISALFGETGDPKVSVRGAVVALDTRSGKRRWKTFMVPKKHDGGAVWNTPAIDTKTGTLYVGTGNAYHEPAADTTDSIVQLDARTGRKLKHFQATPEDVWNGTENAGEGPDYDFGASPNLLKGTDGQALVGEGQKSGTYWALDRRTMKPVWNTATGPGAQVGGIIGSTAWDGDRVYGPDTVGGELWALDEGGSFNWLSADGGPARFNPVSVANGVVYTTDMNGSLTARDAQTGAVLTRLPLGSPTWAGTAIAGGSVFVSIGIEGGTGWIVSYRPREDALSGTAGGGDDRGARRGDPHPERNANEQRDRPAKRRQQYGYPRDGHGRPEHKGDKHEAEHEHQGSHDHKPGKGGGAIKGLARRGDRFVPKPVGTTEEQTYYYGPYTIPPGQDLNRVDLELPTRNGFLLSINPSMRRVGDLSEPMHQEAHIHHAHWFEAEPGSNNKGDIYFGGNAEWIFGNGDEETMADFRPRSAADPDGPVYGQYIPAGKPQPMVYMLHNKTAQPLTVYIVLDVAFTHGTPEALEAKTGRPYRDVEGVLFGRTYDVPRQPNGDGKFEYAKDGKGRQTYGSPRDKIENSSGPYIEWTAPYDAVAIGTGGHLHPGGLRLVAENYGSEENPCPDDGQGYGGTLLLNSDARFRRAPLSEDFQMEVSHPGWRAPIHKGDRIRISGTYENKKHAWYAVMTHFGMYLDRAQQPWEGCKPKIINTDDWNPVDGVLNRPWTGRVDHYCGERWGGPPCEHPDHTKWQEVHTNRVTIANFVYTPGDRAPSEPEMPVIQSGETLTFFNADQAAGIRHTVTTCSWPCNGRYVANYPLADGRWDSGTMGYDLIDKGQMSPLAETPEDLKPGKYAYFCRIHPWMRGAFKIER
jgi:polyvinyl alcohol dehydrogenase (cytochrome)